MPNAVRLPFPVGRSWIVVRSARLRDRWRPQGTSPSGGGVGRVLKVQLRSARRTSTTIDSRDGWYAVPWACGVEREAARSGESIARSGWETAARRSFALVDRNTTSVVWHHVGVQLRRSPYHSDISRWLQCTDARTCCTQHSTQSLFHTHTLSIPLLSLTRCQYHYGCHRYLLYYRCRC